MINYFSQVKKLDENITKLYEAIQLIRTPRFLGNFNSDEIKIICFLGENASSNMKDLAKYLKVNLSTLTGKVDRLEAKEVIFRGRVSPDRRRCQVALRDEWQETYDIYIREQQRISQIMFQSLGKKNFDLLVKVISETSAILDEKIPTIKRLV